MTAYATAHNPPTVENLRRYNVNRGLAGLGNGEFLRREAEYYDLARIRRIKAAAEVTRRAALTQAERDAEDAAKAAALAKIQAALAWKTEYAKTMVAGRTIQPVVPLTWRGKKLQKIALARDWDALFKLIPLEQWPRHWSLAKYSFWGDGVTKRVYKKWSEADIRKWVYGPYYTVAPGYVCTDAQRETGVAAYMKAQARHVQKFASTDWRHIWPIFPGSGFGNDWQQYGCQGDKDSWWVKFRAPVVAAVAIVAAIYLGPIVLAKITGTGAAEGGAAAAGAGAAGTGEALATGIVGAGTKAGVVTAVTTKATAAAITVTQASSAAAAVAGAVEAGTLLSKAKTAVDLINKARTIDALISGEMPPPPIGISGDSFTEWALDIAKDELADELTEQYGEHLTKKMRDKLIAAEESRLRAEIEAMQRELAGLVNEDDVMPALELDPDVRAKILEMQAIERQRKQNQGLLALAVGAGALMVMS